MRKDKTFIFWDNFTYDLRQYIVGNFTSYRRLAKATGINYVKLNRIANGLAEPSVHEFFVICSVLRMRPEQYFSHDVISLKTTY